MTLADAAREYLAAEAPTIAAAKAILSSRGMIERNSLFALLMACPGYASYCFQPNRILDAHRAETGYFWTKGRDGDFDGTVEFYPDGKPRWKNRNYRWVQLLNL